MELLERWFRIRERGSTPLTEARGALATFLAMAYILFANPAILAAAGVPREPAVAATALAAGICSIAMGLGANLPVALASGMGLNAVVALQIAPRAGGWEEAMGLVVWDGLIVLALVFLGVREAVLEAIPIDLRRAIAAGIGLFIAFIGLVNAQIVLPGPPGGPPVAFGSFHSPAALTALFGLLVSSVLLARGRKGALLAGIAAAAVVAALSGGVPAMRWGAPSFDTVFRADLGAIGRLDLLPLLLALVLVDFFDTLGTASSVAMQAGLAQDGRIPGMRRLLTVDALSASVGGALGVSSVTSYIESAAGVAEGARTGLHSVLVGLLFLASILLGPLAAAVPSAATAPALILVGFLMIAQVGEIDWRERVTAVPAFLTLLAIPLTYSISHGIGIGLVLYVCLNAVANRRLPHPLLLAAAALFAAYLLGDGR